MELFWMIVLFLVGILLIVKGGDWFVDASTWIAEVSGVPKFIIGATIVSLATTLPEIIVSCMAAAEGKVDMAIGNAIGSVTANTGMILSIGILFMPVAVKRKEFGPKSLILLGTIGLLLLLSLNGRLTVLKSLALFAVFALFLFENLHSAKAENTRLLDAVKGVEVTVVVSEYTEKERPKTDRKAIAVNVLKFVAGAAGIVVGSRLLVDNGSSIARAMGVPENIIGLTAIAIGTSLPELVTTISAVAKKESSLSVGNVLGANIIDTALILPICSMIFHGSLPVSHQVLTVDLPVCLLVAAIAVIPTLISKRFRRWQGIAGLAVYIGYLVYICVF